MPSLAGGRTTWCGGFAVLYEFAAPFSFTDLFAAGRGKPPPLRRNLRSARRGGRPRQPESLPCARGCVIQRVTPAG